MPELSDAWTLFGDTWLAGGLAAMTLAICGVFVVARRQIFLGAAVAQSATLGCALGLAIGADDEVAAALAVAFSIAAALPAAASGGNRDRRDAWIGWTFAFAASLAILLVTHSPHALEEVHRLVASSIIGASRTDVTVFAALLVVTAALVARFRAPLALLALDPLMAAAVGVRVHACELLVFGWIGLCVGLTIRCAGLLYAFGCLALPALVAARLARRVLPLFALAPLVAGLACAIAFALAHAFDLPPAQAAVALLCVLLPLAALGRRATG